MIEKARLKSWLAGIPNGRQWLAEQCGVSKATVDGWCSTRIIPGPAIRIITQLMVGTATRHQVTISLSPDEYALVETATAMGGYATLDTFAHHAVMEAADALRRGKKNPERDIALVAEEPAIYQTTPKRNKTD